VISVLNFKKFDRGSILGFFDLRYHGLTIKGCRLMAGNNGGSPWFSFPMLRGEQDGKTKYLDQMFVTVPEREHVRALVLAELESQGHFQRSKPAQSNGRRSDRTPEGEDLSEFYTAGQDDNIPF
jgi:hypothetical protein